MGTEEFLIYLFTCLLSQIQVPPLISCVTLGKSLNLSVPLFPLGELRNNINTIHFTGCENYESKQCWHKYMSENTCFGCCQCCSYYVSPLLQPTGIETPQGQRFVLGRPGRWAEDAQELVGPLLCGLPFSAVFPEWGPIRLSGIFFFPFVFPNPDRILNWTSLGWQQTRGSSGGLRP